MIEGLEGCRSVSEHKVELAVHQPRFTGGHHCCLPYGRGLEPLVGHWGVPVEARPLVFLVGQKRARPQPQVFVG